MFSDEELHRYNRHLILPEIGIAGQEKLQQANVLVIGAGGLGCPVLQYLTAAGVGNIGIVDFDTVDASNLQRQILFGVDDIGSNKAEAAAKRLSNLNPNVTFSLFKERLDVSNALKIIASFDLVVDGTDNFATRYLVNDACVISGKPLVYGAIFKFEGQVSVFNYQNGPTYRCIFPEPPEPGSVPSCNEIGVLGVLPGLIGTQQANEALKIILGIGIPLSGKLLSYNALTAKTYTLEVSKNPSEIQKVLERKNDFASFDYDFFCGLKSGSENIAAELSVNQLKQLLKEGETLQIIDVREPHEVPKIEELNSINIPVGSIEEHLDQLSKEAKTVVYCQHGVRSRHAVDILEDAGFRHLYNLTGGIVRW